MQKFESIARSLHDAVQQVTHDVARCDDRALRARNDARYLLRILRAELPPLSVAAQTWRKD